VGQDEVTCNCLILIRQTQLQLPVIAFAYEQIQGSSRIRLPERCCEIPHGCDASNPERTGYIRAPSIGDLCSSITQISTAIHSSAIPLYPLKTFATMKLSISALSLAAMVALVAATPLPDTALEKRCSNYNARNACNGTCRSMWGVVGGTPLSDCYGCCASVCRATTLC
jgi:hypothetical protein